MSALVCKQPKYAPLTTDQLDTIHDASMQVLRDVGIKFLDAESCDILKAHGASVEDDIARFDEDLIASYVSKAPAQFTQLARNPANNVEIGGDNIVFAPVYGPPYVLDFDGGRRRATLEDFNNFVKLAYLSPWIHHSGGTVVEPNDIHEDIRHLDMLFSHIKYSDKPFMGSAMGEANAEDSVAMAEILYGKDAIRAQPALITLINVNSPRVFDSRMLGALKVYARNRQAVIVTPFILAGAMSPVTIAGALVQQNAEALAGIALTQMIEPGTPVVYGSFLTNIDLRNGSPVFGSPLSPLAIYASAQLAGRYDLPFRGGGCLTGSKVPDAQAAYESCKIMSATMLPGTNFVLHAAGWLEGGLASGYEKFVLDCEILGMYHRWAAGIDFAQDELALDAIAEVAPGGHHLETDHTFERFREAFYEPELFDSNSFERWEEEGSQDAYKRANGHVNTLLKEYSPPELDESIEAALIEFMERRKQAIGG